MAVAVGRSGPQRVLIALLACVAAAVPASAASAATPWTRCSKAAGNTAASQAGLPRALDADPVLRRIFGTTRPPSAVYKTPRTSLCGDFDGDGHADRALLYECCTVSSPAPWVVLRRRGSAWQIAYRRLHDTTFKLEGKGARLITTEPRYAHNDANCCPSRLRIGTLRWTGSSFKRTFRIVKAKNPGG